MNGVGVDRADVAMAIDSVLSKARSAGSHESERSWFFNESANLTV